MGKAKKGGGNASGNAWGGQAWSTEDTQKWQHMMMEMMNFMSGKGKKGQGKGKGKGKHQQPTKRKAVESEAADEGEGSRKRKKHKPEARDLEPLKVDVLTALEENGGFMPLSDVASKCPCTKAELVKCGFVFGPPNDAEFHDVNVYPPDTVVPDDAPVPAERTKRKTEIEVMEQILDFMDENGGHAALRDIHRKFKLKEKPKKRMEALGFTFADNVEHGGCEVHMPEEAQGDTREEWMEKAADIAREKNIYSKHFR